jgi:two-component system, NtrC family, response regulator HydG
MVEMVTNAGAKGPKPHLLVVDDRANMLHLLDKVLRPEATVHTAASGTEAVRILEQQPVAAVVCDLRMPDMSGIDVLRVAKRLQPSAEFVLMTAYASVPTAIEAMREGAYDYVTKPFDPDNLRAIVLRAMGRASVAPDASRSQPIEVLPGVLGQSEIMRQLADQVRRVAATDATALIVGEAGTGKERIARIIHELGSRAGERMLTVNVAALRAESLEAEIFGYARGAFAGAQRDRAGLFEEAALGTLFLDEIGDMRLSLQAKLTRVIEGRTVRRLGESKEHPVNVRLIAATHRNVEAMVQAGSFREDLWYRLNVAVISVPPLRKRRDDIELLALNFLRERAALAPRRNGEAISAAALEALTAYDWPGNVRQLRSVIERAGTAAASASIDLEHLPSEVTAAGASRLGSSLLHLKWHDAIERGRREAARQYLRAVLQRHQGRIADAALHAGVERESFYRLLRRYGVQIDGTLTDTEE